MTPAAAAVKTTCTVTVRAASFTHILLLLLLFSRSEDKPRQPANDVDRSTRLFFYRSQIGSREHLRDLVSVESLRQTAGV